MTSTPGGASSALLGAAAGDCLASMRVSRPHRWPGSPDGRPAVNASAGVSTDGRSPNREAGARPTKPQVGADRCCIPAERQSGYGLVGEQLHCSGTAHLSSLPVRRHCRSDLFLPEVRRIRAHLLRMPACRTGGRTPGISDATRRSAGAACRPSNAPGEVAGTRPLADVRETARCPGSRRPWASVRPFRRRRRVR